MFTRVSRLAAALALALVVFGAPIAQPIAGEIMPHIAIAYADPTPGSGGSQAPQQRVDCSVWNGTWITNFPSCLGAELSGFIGGALVGVTSMILTLVGVFFDWTLYHTIIDFGGLISKISSSIDVAWTAFRDIANIVIIGMFVFIAIETILGNENYGYKKFLARVLIIAVLINFSLLFTKIIIDISNFTAVQFYKAAMPLPTPTAGADSNAETASIAKAFMDKAGVTGFSDTRAAVKAIALQPNGGFIQSLFFGIFVAILYLAAAVVLLYGTFLLISRAILMVFLMLTSAIAFGSHLVPGGDKSSFGWSTWWEQLLRNAVFAPLLMTFLWISLLVAGAFKVSKGSLGDLAANPSSQVDSGALFGYMVVVGLLFISFKAASSFSNTISGFSYASMLPRLGFGAAANTATWAGRTMLGGGATALARNNTFQSMVNKLPSRLSGMLNAGLYNAAKGSYDPRNMKGVEKGAKMMGVDLGAGTGKGGYLKQVADATKKVQGKKEDVAEFITGKTNADRRAKLAVDESKERQQGHEADADKAKKEHDEIRSEHMQNAERELAKAEADLAAKRAELTKAQNGGDPAEIQKKRDEQRQLNEVMQEQKARIARAKAGTDKELQDKLAPSLEKLSTAMVGIEKEKQVRASDEARLKKVEERGEAYANNIANERYLTLFFDKTASKEISNAVKAGLKVGGKDKKDQEKVLKSIRDLLANKPDTPTPTPPPAPPAPPAPPSK